MDLIPAHFTAKHHHSLTKSNRRINIWHGSVRSSKTTMSILRWLRFIDSEAPPNVPLGMVGKTQRTIENNVLEPMSQIVGRDLKIIRGRGEAKIWGKTLRLYGANDIKAEEKIRGGTWGGAYCDEITTYPEPYFKRVLDRCSVEGAKIFGTTNPDSPNHWLKKDYIDRENELDMAVFHFTLEDNPWLPESYVRNLKLEFLPGTLWFRRYIAGEWVLAEGAIFDMWNTNVHILKGPMPERRDVFRSWAGIDHGTVNPFVALGLHHVRGEPEKIVVAPEWRHDSRRALRQMSDAQYSGALLRWGHEQALVQGINRWYVDPSAAGFIRQMHNDGFRVGIADNAVLDGLRATASLLAANRMQVHESCEGLIDEIPGYVWDPDAQDKGEDKPLKINDHGPDALRYGVMGERRVWRRWALDVPLGVG